MGYIMTKEEFLEKKALGLTNAAIGEIFGLTPRQVSCRTAKWGLNYSNKKGLDESFFSSGTKEAYYWAGVLAADGWIEGARSRIGLAFKIGDTGHLYKFKKAIKAGHEVCPFMNGTASRIRFNSEKMVADLATIFNITPAKTFKFTLPYFEDDDLFLEFMRGYIDGDGNITERSSGSITFGLCSANSDVLMEIRALFSILLGRPIHQTARLELNPKGQCYSIRFTVADSKELLRLLYKNSSEATRLERKYLVAKDCLV